MDIPDVLGEASASKVAAVFADEARARDVATRLRDVMGLGDAQVQLLTPRDRRPGRKLEPESHGIFRTMLRAHAWLGVAGIAAGTLLFLALWVAGVPMVAGAPLVAGIAIVLLSGMAGPMLGGLVTLRPDHDPYILSVLEALGEGRGAVVVHATDPAQHQRAVDWLQAAGGEVVATLAPPADAGPQGDAPRA